VFRLEELREEAQARNFDGAHDRVALELRKGCRYIHDDVLHVLSTTRCIHGEQVDVR
jgi:hypothetical protein